MTVVRSGSASHIGRVRSTNQDLALETSSLFAVADGMGGHVGGEVAARLAVDALRQTFEANPTAEGLIDAVEAANSAVWSEAQEQDDLRGMGTTLTVAALVRGSEGGDVISLANVGDSRAYVFADGDLSQITADHSLAEERVRQGSMSEEEAAVHPYRHILTRALGIGPGVDVDLWELHLRTGDRLLLCSDGLTNEVSDEEISRFLAGEAPPGSTARRLVDVANRHGGNDNITVVVVDVLVGEDDGGSQSRRSPATVSRAGAAAAAATGTALAGEGVAGATEPGAPGRQGGEPGGPGPADPNVTSMLRPVGPAEGRSRSRAQGGTATAVADAPSSTGLVVVPGAPGVRRLEEEPTKLKKRRRRAGVPRPVTVRVVLFLLLFVGVLIGAYYFVRWYAGDAYYVTVDHNQLVIYQGRPGGVLWFKPTLAVKTGVTTAQIPPADVATVQRNVTEPTLSAARGYVNNLRQDQILNQQLQTGSGPFGGTIPPTAPTTALPPTTPPTTAPSSTTGTPTTPTTAPPAPPAT